MTMLSKAEREEISKHLKARNRSHLNCDSIVELYDALRYTSVGCAMRSRDRIFSLTENVNVLCNRFDPFSVYGSLDTIRKLLRGCSETLQTVFEEGETKKQLYGTKKEEDKVILEVGVMLDESVPYYTRVTAYRIRGKTENFHQWYLALRRCLREPLLVCELNTSIEGEAELM